MKLLTVLLFLWTSVSAADSACEAQAKKDPVTTLVNLMVSGEGKTGSLTLDELILYVQTRDFTNPFRARERSAENLHFANGFDKVAPLVMAPADRDRVFQGLEKVIRLRQKQQAQVDTARDQTQFILLPKLLDQMETDYPTGTSWGSVPAGLFEGRPIFLVREAKENSGPNHMIYEFLLDPMNLDPKKRVTLTHKPYLVHNSGNEGLPIPFIMKDGSQRLFFQDGEIFDLKTARTLDKKFGYGGLSSTDFFHGVIAQTKEGPKLLALAKAGPEKGWLFAFDLENQDAPPKKMEGSFINLRVDSIDGDPIVSVTDKNYLVATNLNSGKIFDAILKAAPEGADRYFVYVKDSRLFALYHPVKVKGAPAWEILRTELTEGDQPAANSKRLAEFGGFATALKFFRDNGRPFARMAVGDKLLLIDLLAETSVSHDLPGSPDVDERAFTWNGQTHFAWTNKMLENQKIGIMDLNGSRFEVGIKVPKTILYFIMPFQHDQQIYALTGTSGGMPYLILLTPSVKEVP